MRLWELYEAEQLNEFVSYKQFVELERDIDKLFNKIGIDVIFTKHFMDRVNDERNKKDKEKGKEITVEDLEEIFQSEYYLWGNKIKNTGEHTGLFVDNETYINVPFGLNYDKRKSCWILNPITAMLKKGFKPYKDNIIYPI